MIAPH